MRDSLKKQVALEEPTPLLDQENLGSTQRECKPNLKIAQENEDLLESLIAAGAVKQFADAIAWS